MDRYRTVPALGFALVVFCAVEPALAECTDVPQPGVYWRRCVHDGQDLQGVDLTGAMLRDGSFKRADLSDADLSGADARRAKFVSATMRNTDLSDSDLGRADLTNADLTDASLRQADLTMAKLYRANLRGADLTDARLDGTDFHLAELGGATWVDGTTICSEGSVGQCHAARAKRELSEVEPSG